ncbi:MAG TPA: hypothetical protein PK796_03330 [Bacteroidales bacterium]|nr:hypothetical protein [Bacteroidales bacterium]
MKKIRILLILSIFLNLVFLVIIYFLRKEDKVVKETKEPNKIEIQRQTENDVILRKNFESMFYKCNDSIYRNVWNSAFEEEPEMAFLISSTYYFVTKDDKILKDIETSNSQLKEIYYQKINIRQHLITPN